MQPSLDSRARALFDAVFDLVGDERAAAIERLCGGDAAVRERVEALLAAAEKDDEFLNDSKGEKPAELEVGERPGTDVGPYRILERIGEGGFGSVFLAEQQRPIRRRVALKVVKLGMDTRQVIARFEQERQALALMDHPNIAKVLDAGATDAGRPYFVMELVQGRPITAWCDAERATIPQRLELFTQVCRAVQHAHTKGVIHRDIKPSNILVSSADGRPEVKVIDFGIAKATQQRLTELTVMTQQWQFIGTPEYMSPEQALGSLDIDTRTDVYALGVLLYELLTGTTPFDGAQLRAAAHGEIQRVLREVDPPLPSSRVTVTRRTTVAVAAMRRTEPQRLGSALRGELDWIVMRALEKERARRYDTAGDLAAEIERHLRGEPVLAAPPGAVYRIGKTLRRHRLAVGVGAVVVLALLAGTGVALWQARIAANERDAATAWAEEAEQRSREIDQVANFEAARLRAIQPSRMGAQMLEDLVENARTGMLRRGLEAHVIDEREAQLAGLLQYVNGTSLALETLDANIFEGALRAVDEEFVDQPAVRLRLLLTMGSILIDLGLLDRAVKPLEDCLELARVHSGDEGDDTLLALNHLGDLRMAQGQPVVAEVHFREVYEVRRSVDGAEHRETLTALNNVCISLLMQGRTSEAETCLRTVFDAPREGLGPDHPETLHVVMNLGGLMMEQGRPSEATPFFREALEQLHRTQGPDNVQSLVASSNLAFSLEEQGLLAEAEPLYRDSLDRARRGLGENHRFTLLFKSNLGFLLCSLGRLDEAEQLTTEALETRRRIHGDAQQDTLQSLHNTGVLRVAQGRTDDAERCFRAALEKLLELHGAAHAFVTQTRAALAALLRDEERFAEAEPLLVDAERDTAVAGNAKPSLRAKRMQDLIGLYEAWDRAEPGNGRDERAAYWRSALAKLEL